MGWNDNSKSESGNNMDHRVPSDDLEETAEEEDKDEARAEVGLTSRPPATR